MKILRWALSLALPAALAGACSNDARARHAALCQAQKKLIVHDPGAWDDYRALSLHAHQQEKRASPPMDGRALYDPVGPFVIRYGEHKAATRPTTNSGEIVRNDLFITKNGAVVAQLVDHILAVNGSDGPTGYNCLPTYSDLILP